jgi:hypothetical protein
MDRRNFLKSSSRLMLVTSGLFVTGKFLIACHKDDDNNFGGYYNGYYNGYYDDRQAIPNPATKAQAKATQGAAQQSNANPK